jgi:PAS domain S-box-containing protein
MALSNHTPDQETKPQFFSGEAVSVHRFLAVMQESGIILCILTPRGEMQEVSPSWQNFTGQEENECRGRGWLEAFHPADQPLVEEALIQTVTSGQSSEHTRQMRRYDESYRLIRWRLTPVHEPSGIISELVCQRLRNCAPE